MSLLWEKTVNLSRFMRPSPKHNIHSRFAQSINFTHYIQFPPIYEKADFHRRDITVCLPEKAMKTAGSMTVEAAVVLPLFLFFFLNLGSAMEMIRLHCNLQLALWQVGERLAVYGHILETAEEDGADGADIALADAQAGRGDSIWADMAGIALSYIYVKDQVEDYLGAEYLEASPLKNGSAGLQFPESDINEAEDCFEIVMTYQAAPLGSQSGFLPFRMANKYYGHFWNGYAVDGEANEEEYVYVAQNGEVYHVDRECTHLMLSVKQVSLQEACAGENREGEKYRACDVCCDGLTLGQVYITEQGDCYHYRKSCSGLKRTVYKMTLSQAEAYRACSRCVGGN